ncbi:MAG: type III-B CRISPR module RAMP protein Cmr4 [Gammaproteobacteria bacterium]|nr:type III-B CRISPR module RAMP protein Cmr4 [Gammaproteobacteria bacterium]
MQAGLFHLHTLSALHCGTGQSADVVDLPIARARATRLPMVPGSSLRGVLRQQVEQMDCENGTKNAAALFGPRSISSSDNSFAGALAVGDAHLLALPVRCLAGIVSYATSPFILRRYARDLARAGIDDAPPLPSAPAEGEARVAKGSVNRLDDKLVLEDLDLAAQEDCPVTGWAQWIAKTVYDDDNSRCDFIHRFALLHDEIMDFLAETATEVRARIRIDQSTGTVDKGALWYEEHLPAETLLWGVYALSARNHPDDTCNAAELAGTLPDSGTLLQLGGGAGTGHGLVRFVIRQAEKA